MDLYVYHDKEWLSWYTEYSLHIINRLPSANNRQLSVSNMSDATLPAPILLREPPATLLDPARLNDEAAQAVSAFFHEGQSANTARTYKTALQYWGAWHAARYGRALAAPVAVNVVVQFIVDHLEHDPNRAAPAVTPYSRTADTTQHLLPPAIDRFLVERHYKAKIGPWSFATVETRLAALSKAHEIYRIDNPHLGLGPEANPMRDPKVRSLLAARAPGLRASRPRALPPRGRHAPRDGGVARHLWRRSAGRARSRAAAVRLGERRPAAQRDHRRNVRECPTRWRGFCL